METLEKSVSQFFENAAKNGLEQRFGQVEMAIEVSEVIALKRPLAVEAEVGIGKSFAYLVPALMQYRKEHRQIVIATSTIALQEQLRKDARRVMRMLGKIKHNIPDIQKEHELSELYNFVRKAYHSAKDSIIWLDDEPEIRLCICKKDIRSDIRSLLYQMGRSTILTSATITGNPDGTPREQYEYFLDSIGYPGIGAVAEPKKSPFDYEWNTMLYCSTNLPFPKHDDMEVYRRLSIQEIVDLLGITHGKTLILFTAKSDMLYVYKKLSNMGLPYRILMQSKASSQEHQLDKFRNDTNSVILGTGTYWEGINIEGESLSQVIIYKLPFPVPDPIIDYKMSLTDHPIQDVAVPEMLIKLRQGVGRLIRSETDCGIVSILDPRLSSRYNSSYVEMARSVLPVKNVTEEITEIKEFWDKLSAERNV